MPLRYILGLGAAGEPALSPARSIRPAPSLRRVYKKPVENFPQKKRGRKNFLACVIFFYPIFVIAFLGVSCFVALGAQSHPKKSGGFLRFFVKKKKESTHPPASFFCLFLIAPWRQSSVQRHPPPMRVLVLGIYKLHRPAPHLFLWCRLGLDRGQGQGNNTATTNPTNKSTSDNCHRDQATTVTSAQFSQI
jgi:hypothetical protein